MGLFDFVEVKRKDFFGTLVRQAEITLEGIRVLKQYMVENSVSEQEIMEEITNLENKADEIRRILIDDLKQTFITPFDREDIYEVSRAIDDIIDHAYAAIMEMEAYRLMPNSYLQFMITTIFNGVKKLRDAVLHLERHPNITTEHCIRAKIFIKQMDNVYCEAINDLVERNNLAYMFKMREIYRRLFQLGESVTKAANILTDVVLKMI